MGLKFLKRRILAISEYKTTIWLSGLIPLLPEKIKQFLHDAALFCEVIDEVAKHSSMVKAHDLLCALVENQPNTIRAQFNQLLKNINENNFYAPLQEVKEAQKQAIRMAIAKMPPYWLERFENAVLNQTPEEAITHIHGDHL